MKYVIFDIQNIDSIDFTKVEETSRDTLRISLNGLKCVLKFENETPDFLVGLQQYNYQEIINIMHSNEWTNNE